jgi:hypothetical protein
MERPVVVINYIGVIMVKQKRIHGAKARTLPLKWVWDLDLPLLEVKSGETNRPTLLATWIASKRASYSSSD